MSRPAVVAIGVLALTAQLVARPAGAAVSYTSVVTGLSAPTAFVDPPDPQMHRFIAQQSGNILVWDGSNGTNTLATPALDIRGSNMALPNEQRKVQCCGERGLLAMVPHPNWATTHPYMYVYYTARDWDTAIPTKGGPVDGPIELGDIVVERFTRDSVNPNLLDFSTAKVILHVSHPDGNHNGGDLKFGPDGYLYVTLGDGGGGCDSTAHSGQDPEQLLGKMLRIDVDGDDFPDPAPDDTDNPDYYRNYAIPPDNPLVGVGGRDEIWVLGLRNPFRFTFDRASGDIYIGDVGQDDWEELNHLPAGDVMPGSPVNFGWPCREGFDASGCSNPPQGCGATFTDPVRQHPNAGEGGNWLSIMGGYYYRGSAVSADLAGLVVHGDASNGQVWAATPTFPTPAAPGWPASQIGTGQGPYGFAEDVKGELYVLSNWNGAVRCITNVASSDPAVACPWALEDAEPIFADGLESGDTMRWSVTVP